MKYAVVGVSNRAVSMFMDPIINIPLFGGREQIDVIESVGGHGGGSDPLLRDELFVGKDPQEQVQRQAGLDAGIDAGFPGVAVNKSVLEHRVVPMNELRQIVYGLTAKIGSNYSSN
ncbi:MAG: hypothetical protein ABIG61_03145 [Planctomycetota bacterium]